jgi:hypothetical protein
MRLALVIAPLAIAASPALAQAPAAPAQPPAAAIPPQLTDPRTTDKLVDAMQALSRAFLSLPVGDVQAALEGRKATSADHRRTVRSETKMTDAELRARIAAARPVLQQGMQSLAQALPSMMQGLEQAQKSLERAAANMPDPTYPKR